MYAEGLEVEDTLDLHPSFHSSKMNTKDNKVMFFPVTRFVLMC